MNRFILFFLFAFGAQTFYGQTENNPEVIRAKLDSLSSYNNGLNDTLTMTVNDITLDELIRGIGNNHNINVNVSTSLNTQVVATSFSAVPVKDVLVFLVKEYRLQITFTGNILSFSPYLAPKKNEVYIPKQPILSYNNEDDKITFDFNNDSIKYVCKEITRITGKNVLFTPDVENTVISGYIQSTSFSSAIEKLALINNLIVDTSEVGFFVFKSSVTKEGKNAVKAETTTKYKSIDPLENIEGLKVSTVDSVYINVIARNVDLSVVIEGVANFLNKEFFIYNSLVGEVNLNLQNVSFETFINYALNGTNFTYSLSDGVYLFGDQNTQGLRNTEIIKLENRTVEKIIEYIPTGLSTGLQIKEFLDLNAIVVTGSSSKIRDLRNFIREVDQVIPMVYIEVMLVDVNKSKSISAGISAGVGKTPEPIVSGGTITPATNFEMNSQSVNNLINGFNAFGIVNLGHVTPDFYLSIQALETAGVLKTRSTPKLSALNGQEASLNIGRTEYYLEIRNDLIGTQNPTLSTSQVYKPISANTSLMVTPFVSKDEQVTLEIQVVQSDFTERISETAPPGNVQRDFQSVVRVRNGDMIILGGLDNDSKSETGSGLPLISRIPVLKWIFGRRTKSKSESKLSIFLRTSIIY